MNLKMLIIGPPRSGTSMITRVLYYSGITVGGEFEGPNPYSKISVFEDIQLRAVVWSMRDALLADMHRREYRNTPERIAMLSRAVEAYSYEAFKLPNILHAWPTWKEAIPTETIIVLVHRDADLIVKSMKRVYKGRQGQDLLAFVRWCEERMDQIRSEMTHVIDVNYQDFLTGEGQEEVRRKFLEYFPDRPLDFNTLVRKVA